METRASQLISLNARSKEIRTVILWLVYSIRDVRCSERHELDARLVVSTDKRRAIPRWRRKLDPHSGGIRRRDGQGVRTIRTCGRRTYGRARGIVCADADTTEPRVTGSLSPVRRLVLEYNTAHGT